LRLGIFTKKRSVFCFAIHHDFAWGFGVFEEVFSFWLPLAWRFGSSFSPFVPRCLWGFPAKGGDFPWGVLAVGKWSKVFCMWVLSAGRPEVGGVEHEFPLFLGLSWPFAPAWLCS